MEILNHMANSKNNANLEIDGDIDQDSFDQRNIEGKNIPSSTTQVNTAAELAHLYFKEIGYSPLLSAEEEYELAIKTQAGDETAKKKIIESNLRLVVKIARHYAYNSNMEFLDLVEEGNLGLIRAAEKFKPELGYRFSTYATFWINHFIGRAIKNQSRTVRVPIHINAELNIYNRTARDLAKELEREPTTQEIAEALNESPEKVHKLMSMRQETSSLDAPLYDNEDNFTLTDSIVDQNNLDPAIFLQETNLKELLESWLQKLDYLPREVIMRRFGLNNYDKETYEQIGKELNIHPEKARHIQITALQKMRQIIKGSGSVKKDII